MAIIRVRRQYLLKTFPSLVVSLNRCAQPKPRGNIGRALPDNFSQQCSGFGALPCFGSGNPFLEEIVNVAHYLYPSIPWLCLHYNYNTD